MNIEIINNDNIKKINYQDVLIIFFAESGAIGDPGRVDIILKDQNKYKWYKTNYTFIGVTVIIEKLSDIVREEEKIFNILPILRKLNFNHSLIRKSYLIDNDWWLSDLGFGNHLIIRNNELKEKIIKKMRNYSSKELYKCWEEIIKEEIKSI